MSSQIASAVKKMRDILVLHDRGINLLLKKMEELQVAIGRKSRSLEVATSMGNLAEAGTAVRKNQPALHKAAKALMKKVIYEEPGYQAPPEQVLSKGVQTIALDPSKPDTAAQEVDISIKQTLDDIIDLILDTRGTLAAQQ